MESSCGASFKPSDTWPPTSPTNDPLMSELKAERNVTVGDVIWLAEQNALRGQYRLARVVGVNADKKGIIRDVHVKTFQSPQPRYQQLLPSQGVRWIAVLLPIEE